jgi:CheY-like chemotaxis protein
MALSCSVLIVEDEALVAMLLADFLEELGCSVAAQASSVDEGLERLKDTRFDLAVLDVNLRGQRVWPIADVLQEQGKPFVLATGYDGEQTQHRYPQAVILAKPYDLQAVQKILEALAMRFPNLG